MAGALLLLRGFRGRTDQEGRFSFGPIPLSSDPLRVWVWVGSVRGRDYTVSVQEEEQVIGQLPGASVELGVRARDAGTW
jgi:hypothetical protein